MQSAYRMFNTNICNEYIKIINIFHYMKTELCIFILQLQIKTFFTLNSFLIKGRKNWKNIDINEKHADLSFSNEKQFPL